MSDAVMRRSSDVLAILAVGCLVLAVLLGELVLAAVGLGLLLAAIQTTRLLRRRRKQRRPGSAPAQT